MRSDPIESLISFHNVLAGSRVSRQNLPFADHFTVRRRRMNYQPPQPPPPGGEDPYGQDPYAQQNAQPDPVEVEKKKRKKQLWILGGLAAVLIVLAFFGGKALEKKNYEPGEAAYVEIYNKGAAAGKAVGTKQGVETGQEQGQKQGKEEGVAEGTEQGKKAGEAAGQSQGEAKGSATALGGFSSWDTNAPYVVEMATGPSDDIPYVVQDRTEMQPDTLYKICASGSGICTEEDSGS
jgi:hypothetical protein